MSPFAKAMLENRLVWTVPLVFLILFGGFAAYFVCLWPGKHPVRRISVFVCLPVFVSLGLVLTLCVLSLEPRPSVLEASHAVVRKMTWLLPLLGELPLGFQFAALGMTLVCVFQVRQIRGKSRLPIGLATSECTGREDEIPWHRIGALVFVLVGPLLFLEGVAPILFLVIGSHPAYIAALVWKASVVLDFLILAGLVVLTAQSKSTAILRRALRIPNWRFVLLAVAGGTFLGILIPAGHFVFDRIHWASRDYGKFLPPELSSYFVPITSLFLWMGIGVLAEEIVFRRLLQPLFVRRYDIYRGIFLVSLIWAAYHFPFDSYSRLSYGGSFLNLGTRIFSCLSLGFVVSWFALKSGSVWPGTIAHFLFNLSVTSQSDHGFPRSDLLFLALWAVFAYVLFRYWPVEEAKQTDIQLPVVSPEPAT
jgi:membrane protease YdiL (CAAX protease family)